MLNDTKKYSRHPNWICYTDGMTQVVTYEQFIVDNQLTFILTSTKVIVKTPHQTNIVTYHAGNYKKQLERLQDKIRNGELKTITELIEYNRPRSVGEQIQGLVLVPTRMERHL